MSKLLPLIPFALLVSVISAYAAPSPVRQGGSLVVCQYSQDSLNDLLNRSGGIISGHYSIDRPFSVSAPSVAVIDYRNLYCVTLTKL